MIQLIDSAAVLNSPGFSFAAKSKFITTPQVADELRDMRSRQLVQNALQNSLLVLNEPSAASIAHIEGLAAKHGFSKLSKPDISLLALALDIKNKNKKFILITDDYSVQNFCALLKIEFDSVIRGKIEKVISFKKRCTGCNKKFSPNSPIRKCPECGSRVSSTRKP